MWLESDFKSFLGKVSTDGNCPVLAYWFDYSSIRNYNKHEPGLSLEALDDMQ